MNDWERRQEASSHDRGLARQSVKAKITVSFFQRISLFWVFGPKNFRLRRWGPAAHAARYRAQRPKLATLTHSIIPVSPPLGAAPPCAHVKEDLEAGAKLSLASPWSGVEHKGRGIAWEDEGHLVWHSQVQGKGLRENRTAETSISERNYPQVTCGDSTLVLWDCC